MCSWFYVPMQGQARMCTSIVRKTLKCQPQAEAEVQDQNADNIDADEECCFSLTAFVLIIFINVEGEGGKMAKCTHLGRKDILCLDISSSYYLK